MRHNAQRILSLLICAALLGCSTIPLERGCAFPELMIGQRYGITAIGGPYVSGVLLEERPHWIKMDFGNTVHVGWKGVVWVPREQVKLIQVLSDEPST